MGANIKKLQRRKILTLAAPALLLPKVWKLHAAEVTFFPFHTLALMFTGGGITSLTSILTAGAAYTNGSYTSVPLVNSTGLGTGATANITVAGGIVTACTLVLPGAVVGVDGAFGYTTGDSLTVAAANVGGTGSGFTIGVATVSSYTINIPPWVQGGVLNAVSGGGAGGSGFLAGGGGGGGGGGAGLDNYPLHLIGKQQLTITCGMPGLPGTVSNADCVAATDTIVSGAALYNVLPSISAGFFGNVATLTLGGAGGSGGQQGQGAGGAHGANNGVGPANNTSAIHQRGGAGGGGGGDVATLGGQGATASGFGGSNPGSDNASGGGGGGSLFGTGGKGGEGGTTTAGHVPSLGWGGGGGGGGKSAIGGQGGAGMAELRI